MNRTVRRLWDAVFTVGVLAAMFLLNIAIDHFFDTQTLTPMLFVLGVFLISFKTQGYFWGIAASLISVLAVNYAFTAPYYAIDLITPECMASAVVMLIVACMTGAMTTKIRIQEKLKAESDRERMRANLLRAVSHDLRTPLTSIYGSCSTIIEHYESISKDNQLQLLGEVKEDSEWLIRMVENLLSVTRIDGRKVQVIKTPTVLEELIDAVLVKFKKRCEQQTVIVNIPDEFISIPMDPMLIEQVLINLLENAVYHAKGMQRLELSVTHANNKAEFCVSDDGCGIPPEKLRNLYVGYLDKDNAASDGGRNSMGIGLSVCAAIIKAHGSEIHAQNRPQGGIAFSFALEMEEENGREQV